MENYDMTGGGNISVAVPWSLSHYIPLNGFHPLYRALFDHAPDTIDLYAWDNVKLHRRFRSDTKMRDAVLRSAKADQQHSERLARESIARSYREYFWPPNRVLTAELMGDIEFHHTAPFPSLKRPFVFHCESFATVLFPFIQQGNGSNADHFEEIKKNYRDILVSPLCLGIFSHLPETLQAMSGFFGNSNIDQKLIRSGIGLSAKAVLDPDLHLQKKRSLSRLIFLFVGSASRDPLDFFRRGGHLVLRFWKEFLAGYQDGLLLLCCAKPSDKDLREYGIDMSLLRSEFGRSIIWLQNSLANYEMNSLMLNAHFLLSPGVSLDSVSIMQAMTLGTVPVVTDIVGMSVYVTDNEQGIVLQGMRDSIRREDQATGVPVDCYCSSPCLDNSLVSQLTTRILALLNAQDAYERMRNRTIAYARDQFSGEAFSTHFWEAVFDRYQRYKESSKTNTVSGRLGRALFDCTVQSDEWPRMFESPTQPILRINTGHGVVWELGGAMIHAHGNPYIAGHDWSVFARHFSPGAPPTTFANTLEELGGKYLPVIDGHGEVANRRLVRLVSKISSVLKPFPTVHRYARHVFLRFGYWAGYRSTKPTSDPDIELARHGVWGYNIIRYHDRYYAILQNEGEFIPEKAKVGGYSSCIEDSSLEKVMHCIATSIPLSVQSGFRENGLRQRELALEGFHGFNIIRQGHEFHAVLQSEWSLVRDELPLRQYRRLFSGFSLEAVQHRIVASLGSEQGPANSDSQSTSRAVKS